MKQVETKPRQPAPPTRHWSKWLDRQIPLWVKVVDHLFWITSWFWSKKNRPKL